MLTSLVSPRCLWFQKGLMGLSIQRSCTFSFRSGSLPAVDGHLLRRSQPQLCFFPNPFLDLLANISQFIRSIEDLISLVLSWRWTRSADNVASLLEEPGSEIAAIGFVYFFSCPVFQRTIGVLVLFGSPHSRYPIMRLFPTPAGSKVSGGPTPTKPTSLLMFLLSLLAPQLGSSALCIFRSYGRSSFSHLCGQLSF